MEESDLILPASAREVTLRLARPDERVRWDALMDERHYLGFRQFAGRGLRYVAEYEKQWLALIGWQSGAFKCRPRDRWIGWAPAAAVPPLAADCQQHPHAAVSAARGSQPGLLCHGRQSAAFERRLAGGLRSSAGVGRDLRGPEALRRHALIGPETGGRSGAPEAFSRSNGRYTQLHGHIKTMARLSPALRSTATVARSPAEPLLGAGAAGAGAPHSAGPALVAARVPGHPGSPSSPGPQVPVAHSAGPLGVGSALRLPGSRCHLAFCRRAEPGGTAQPRRLAKSQDRSLRPSLSGHAASSDDRHRPQAVSIGPSALGGAPATCPHRSGGRR